MYIIKIRFTTTLRGYINWINKNIILYKQFEFLIDKFQAFVRALLVKTYYILYKELLFGIKDPLLIIF